MVVVAIVITLTILVLAIPFDVIFKIERQEVLRSDITVCWLFGVVKLTAPAKKEQKPVKQPSGTKKAKKESKKTAKKSTNFQAIKSTLWNRKFRNRLFKFIKDFFRSIHIASFYMRIRLGLDDPADTGRLWALLGPLAVYLSNLSNATFHLVPDFQTEIVYLDSRGQIRIIPLQVIYTVVAFIFSPVTIRAVWAMSKSSKQ